MYSKIRDFLVSTNFLWCLVVYGALCRIVQQMSYRSLWIDEAKYAVKVIDYSYLEILNPSNILADPFTIKFESAGPLLFFYLSKFLTQWFGTGEFVLRMIPFVSSLAALFLMVRFAKKYCEPVKAAVAVAVALFAVDTVLIIRSADFHPYASDVTVTLALFLMVEYLRAGKFSARDVLVCGLAGAAAIWFSVPSIFVLAGLGGAFLTELLIRNRKGDLLPAGLMVSAWVLSFILSYFGYLKPLSSNMQWPEGGYLTVQFNAHELYRLVREFFTEEPFRFRLWYFPAFVFVWGIIAAFVNDRMRFMYLSFPVFVTLGAAALGKYPFSGRLILFLSPIFMVFIAEGLVGISRLFSARSRVVMIMLLAVLFWGPLPESLKRIVKPIHREEVRPVIAQMKALRRSDEPVYVYAFTGPALHYYAPRFGLDEKDFIFGRYHHGSPETELSELNALKGRPRVWIIYGHVNNPEGRQFLAYLDRIGKKEYSYLQPGAGLLLYDLRSP